MKFCLVSFGAVEIPPKGWGAIEIIVWDYKTLLENMGHEVKIINTYDKKVIEEEIDSFNPDVCHCHYDGYYDILEKCNARLKIMTSHCGSIRGDLSDNIEFRDKILPKLDSGIFYNFCLDPFIKNLYLSMGFNPTRQFVIPNAARKDLIQFSLIPKTTDTVCVGKIQPRKRQHLLEDLNVFFIGDFGWGTFNPENKRLVGMWSKEKLYTDLTHNANLILSSESEAAPLVVLEAMMAGLGVIVSETSVANLDVKLPFIDVIPEKYITDRDYLEYVIQKNKKVSLSMRDEIRKYAEDFHSYAVRIPQYIKTVESIL